MSESANKATVRRYIDGFNKLDADQILSCLTEDIRWTVFGHFQLAGKEAYRGAISNPDTPGKPRIEIIRMVEDGNTIMAELYGEADHTNGSTIRMAMGEVFVFRGPLICERRAFVIPLQENDFR